MKSEKIIEEAKKNREVVYDNIVDAANLFINDIGLMKREIAVEKISDELELAKGVSREIIGELVSDTVDPVIQVPSDEKYIGVVEYIERDGWYGYINYDDITGDCKRGVCAQCVKEADHDLQVDYADRPRDTDWDEIDDVISSHYDESHEVEPDEVEVGASLASGTTIGANTAIHTGNESKLSIENASTSSIDTKQFVGPDGNGSLEVVSASSRVTAENINSISDDSTKVLSPDNFGVISQDPSTILSVFVDRFEEKSAVVDFPFSSKTNGSNVLFFKATVKGSNSNEEVSIELDVDSTTVDKTVMATDSNSTLTTVGSVSTIVPANSDYHLRNPDGVHISSDVIEWLEVELEV